LTLRQANIHPERRRAGLGAPRSGWVMANALGKTGVALAAAILAGSGAYFPARADIVTFDDSVGQSLVYTYYASGESFSDQGLTFTSHGTEMYLWGPEAANTNGTNNNLFAGFATGDFETITKTGGGAFNLISLDLAISDYDSNPTETITINGSPLTITQTLTTYTLDLYGVTSVDISGVPSNTGYWTADNIVFTVPETPAWVMMVFGFASLAAMMVRAPSKFGPRRSRPKAV
jgi:hypothetical protein